MLKAYASYFVSYLLTNLKDISNISTIILFGSTARDEAKKDSDIDIFIDVKSPTKKFSKDTEKLLEKFYKSREALIFKVKGIDNKINLIAGKLDEWRDLKKSIESNGIVLYGKYLSTNIEGKKYAVIFWNNIRKNRGAFLNKIYGFRVKDKQYKGLLEKLNGRKLGKSTIIIPTGQTEEILKLIKHHKVNAKIIEAYF